MLRAYLDTNAYNIVAAEKVPAADVEGFRAALRSGVVVAPVSLANIDELFGLLKTDRSAMIARLSTVRHFVGFQGMLKQPRDIFQEAIEAYVAGSEPPAVILPEPERREIVGILADVIAGSRKHDYDLQQIVSDVEALKDQWLANMQEAASGRYAAALP